MYANEEREQQTEAIQCYDAYSTATHCNTLQHTVTHCNTLQHAATHCNALQRTATHCNALQRTATHRNTPQRTVTHYNTMQHIATHYTTLDHCTTQQQPFRFITATPTRHDILLCVSAPLIFYCVSTPLCFCQCSYTIDIHATFGRAATFSIQSRDAYSNMRLTGSDVFVVKVLRYCVAVCCSVLQCVAVCCSVLQCRQSSQSAQDFPHLYTHFEMRCAHILRGDICA